MLARLRRRSARRARAVALSYDVGGARAAARRGVARHARSTRAGTRSRRRAPRRAVAASAWCTVPTTRRPIRRDRGCRALRRCAALPAITRRGAPRAGRARGKLGREPRELAAVARDSCRASSCARGSNSARGSGMRGCATSASASRRCDGIRRRAPRRATRACTSRFTNEVFAPFSSRRRTRYGSRCSWLPTGA